MSVLKKKNLFKPIYDTYDNTYYVRPHFHQYVIPIIDELFIRNDPLFLPLFTYLPPQPETIPRGIIVMSFVSYIHIQSIFHIY